MGVGLVSCVGRFVSGPYLERRPGEPLSQTGRGGDEKNSLSPGRISKPEPPLVHLVVLKWKVCGLNWTADTD